MTKDTIAYYNDDRVPLSLGNLTLHAGKFVEDIFDAVEDSENFEDLTLRLVNVLDEVMYVDRVTPRYIRYRIIDPWDNRQYLKVKVKERIENATNVRVG